MAQIIVRREVQARNPWWLRRRAIEVDGRTTAHVTTGATVRVSVAAGTYRVRIRSVGRRSHAVMVQVPERSFVQLRTALEESIHTSLGPGAVPTLQWERLGPGATVEGSR